MKIMFGRWLALLIAALAMPAAAGAAAPRMPSAATAAEPYIVLGYHDIAAHGQKTPPFDRMAVADRNFEEHIDWLLAHGYHFISLQQVIDAHDGKAVLPAKAILLTFDDGFESFYTRVFPVLKARRIPAIAALIGTWMDGADKPDVPGVKPVLNWQQVRELQASGLVEIASHSFDMHRSVDSNPEGGRGAAVTTRRYLPADRRYESDVEYAARLAAGMKRSSDFIFKHTGKRPRALVWPFGEYNALSVAAAKKAGMPITLALNDGANDARDSLAVIDRLMMADDPEVPAFADIITTLRADRPQRVMHVDLDYVFDTDRVQQRRNLDALITRVAATGATTVYLQAYSDPDGDGNADALYFPNRHLPVKEDLFGYTAAQLKNRAGVKVYAWMPMMAFKADLPDAWYVKEWRDGKARTPRHIYTRLSPFVPAARRWVGDLYEDLAKYAAFDGVLFHDDGILSDYEDVSPAALAWGRKAWGLPTDVETLRATPASRLAWGRHKAELMADYTDELAARVRVYRSYIKTARNIYSRPILQPDAEEWYAQSLPVFLKHYDFVAVEAMPRMEEAGDGDAWLKTLVATIAATPGAIDRTVFELQSVDWRHKTPVPGAAFGAEVALLKAAGARHFGYYPDDGHTNTPPLATVQAAFARGALP
ncbi:poly-beta-1,6-N-acetyl-D-glucosamine N-deacetylase PgaB [Polymorphobacter fuscus]|uniref:Chitooligosaccharide deacetylase n=1 Tax=Sandarakinorhabdus fusca TaxID=1439888 RepID=A0A7C9GT78_9SPHN|nr:poly-beta-1,6-N-acetyl-D-glucosamine N-deacetylase PgaB [Polymorphobacter fuscus]KAB7644483.1 poly-beta-1,6-N-acetyl-D-glucosamine N-deacetylase PgaB [Polymorphobacter fuscus]MQT18411.1 poly-beta-1,6-N-acetyl-D-glucosamine N-deacetylase PgaB [Polymorphobacter fuscus]NJC08311.1 biofilm PGA synthesis lipoprotein PgaB [Polymorphobacter fuscus]